MSLDAGRVGVRADQVDVHGRVTSPSFLNELLEDLPEWTDMPVWVNGTEELLPSNGSVPVTSPILADIAYLDIRRDNQYFTYRESPTTVDGLAKIKSIKGNTLIWNQIQPNTISRTHAGVTYTYDNGKLTVSGTATSTSWWLYGGLPTMSMKANHKYLFMFGKGMEGASLTTFNWYLPNSGQRFYTDGIITINSDTEQYVQLQVSEGYTINTVLYPQVFDLTQMFGSGNEPSTVDEFISLFPLLYYAYNAGTLLSFNGTGIKTVGKNQLANIVRGYFSVGAGAISVDNDSESFVFYAIKGKTYVSSSAVTLNRNAIARCDTPNLVNGSPIYDVVNTSRTWTATWTGWTVWYVYSSRNETVENSAQVEFGTIATAYEPYTSHTTNLPVSTYFPTGMKSAGSVCDELTPTKAITRIGAVDLGSLTWTGWEDNGSYIFYASITDKKVGRTNPCVCPLYEYNRNVSVWTDLKDKQITGNPSNSSVYIRNSSYTDATAFKTAMSGVYLYYELATPVELPTLSLGE